MISAFHGASLTDEELRKRKDWPKWEAVEWNTYRLSIPGGWLYRFERGLRTEGMVFVPESKLVE